MLQSVVWRVTGDRQKGTRIARSLGARGGGGVVIAIAIYALTQHADLRGRWGGIIGMFIFRGAQASSSGSGSTAASRRRPSRTRWIRRRPPSRRTSPFADADRFLRGHE